MNKEEMDKYGYELMVKNNSQEAVKNLLLKDKELERYKNIIDELEKYLQQKYGEYVDMESDDAFVISLVLDTLRKLKGE